ncbi:MAG: hypothetical protein AAF310_05830 [Myxococcota bacterium]
MAHELRAPKKNQQGVNGEHKLNGYPTKQPQRRRAGPPVQPQPSNPFGMPALTQQPMLPNPFGIPVLGQQQPALPMPESLPQHLVPLVNQNSAQGGHRDPNGQVQQHLFLGEEDKSPRLLQPSPGRYAIMEGSFLPAVLETHIKALHSLASTIR